MNELVYAGQDVERIIKERWPAAVITDASDYIHTERFSVDIEGVEDDEFYVFAIREGFASVCFTLLMLARGTEPQQARVQRLVKEARAEKETP